MTKKNSLFSDLVTVITDITWINTVLYLFSSSQGGAALDTGYLPWFFCGLLVFCANSLFMQKSRAIYAIVGFNLLLFLLQAVVLLIFAVQLNGMAAKVVCLLALALTTLREYFLVLYPTKPEQRLFYTESCVFLVLGFYFIRTGATVPALYDAILFGVLLLNIAALVEYRVFGDRGGAQSGLQRLGSGVGFAAIALLLFAVTAVFTLNLQAITQAVFAAARAVYHVILMILDFLERLFPPVPFADVPMEEGYSGIKEFEEESGRGSVSPLFAKIVLITALIFVLGIILNGLYRLVRFLVRIRHLRLSPIGGARYRQTRLHAKKFTGLYRVLAFFKAKIRFLVLSVVRRNTAPGLLLFLERYGALHFQARRAGETHRQYIGRLIQNSRRDALTESAPLLQRLSDELDYAYYSPGGSAGYQDRLTRAQIIRVKKQIRKTGGIRFSLPKLRRTV